MYWQNGLLTRIGGEAQHLTTPHRLSAVGGSRWPATFTNPLYPGADPFIAQHEGSYHLIQADGSGRIHVSRSETLIHPGRRATIWTPPRTGWNRVQVWAPELHRFGDRWYVYYAASNGRNATHRMGVLESVTEDPQGEYVDRGMLYTGDDVIGCSDNRWAIDGTVLPLHGRLYFVWSGWADDRDVQRLYIAEMSDPCTISSNRVLLCPNDCHPWERVNDCLTQRGLHEGPQVLIRNGRVMLVYSCSGSWQPTYKLGLLYMDIAADPMNPASWQKLDRPVFESTPDVFGVGHCCFVTSPDGSEDWIVYHAKRTRREGWTDRVVRAQPFTWTPAGFPDFGTPAPSHIALPVPCGDLPALPEAA